MRKLSDNIRELSIKSRELSIIAKNPTLSKEKSIEINSIQDEVYKKFIFMKNIAKKLR